MKIGFLSGDQVEVSDDRAGVSVPDYLHHGYLIQCLRELEHEVHVVDSFVPRDLDLLWVDRVGAHAPHHERALCLLNTYKGKALYHQYVGYPGWVPIWKQEPAIADGIEWTIVNRCDDPEKGYLLFTSPRERAVPLGTRFDRWEPFLMHKYWMEADKRPLFSCRPGWRPYAQGYYGRLPRRERRTDRVIAYMRDGDWKKVVYGPPTSTRYLCERVPETHDGGRCGFRFLPKITNTFNFTVTVPFDRIHNKGVVCRQHRLIECALGSVLQLFDEGTTDPLVEEWKITEPIDRIEWLRDPARVEEEVRRQQLVLRPLCEPKHVMEELERVVTCAVS